MTTPEPGDFGLTQISGHVGRLIRVGQWLNGDGFHDYEHAFLYLGDGKIVEAEPGGARVADLSRYEPSHIYWSTGILRPNPEQRTAIIAAGRHYVGVDYSFADYFALAAKRLHLWAPGLNAYVRSSGHMICSQLVAKCYYDGGYPLFGGDFTGNVTPGDLFHLLYNKGR